MIKLENVSKRFKEKQVLENINLNIEEGRCVAFVGDNGSGKSVLLSIISGLLSPTEGKVFVRGKLLGEDIDFPERMGVLINEPGYVSFYSGFQNLYYLSLIKGQIGKGEISEVMKKLNLDPSDKTPVGKYSLGMKQKLGIAQAIMENQDLLILDEPFNALDHKTYNEIFDTLLECKREGKTILLTSHDYRVIEKLADEKYYLERGKMQEFTKEIEQMYFR